MRDEDNVRGGLYGTIQPGRKPALLVVDFQLGFTDARVSPLAGDCDSAVMATSKLIPIIRRLGPVFFTVIQYEHELRSAGIWIEKIATLNTLVIGTEAVKIDPRLGFDNSTDIVIPKTQASAFFGTPLCGLLAANHCDTVFIAGCVTSGCVRASAVDAIQHGYRPFVVRDCVSDRSLKQHESNLIDMESTCAEVVSLDRALNMCGSLFPDLATEVSS